MATVANTDSGIVAENYVIQKFVDDKVEKRKLFYYSNEITHLPDGKVVKLTLEYINEADVESA